MANKEFGEKVEIVGTDNLPPMEVLSKFGDKILYLDFWASWCSPCINSIPRTIELADHYLTEDVEVIFIGNNDQQISLETAIKKYEIKGKHLILDHDESEAWRKEFDVTGIPSYVLLDRDHKVVELHAPHPEDQLIYTLIDSLLNE